MDEYIEVTGPIGLPGPTPTVEPPIYQKKYNLKIRDWSVEIRTRLGIEKAPWWWVAKQRRKIAKVRENYRKLRRKYNKQLSQLQ